MNKSEIMNCAAILAAGIIANDKSETRIGADAAVDLMEEIAAVITERQKDVNRTSIENWVK